MSTASDQLDKVNTAIDAMLEGGAVESYTINGRNLKHIPLRDLMDLQARLQAQVGSENNSTNYAAFERPI